MGRDHGGDHEHQRGDGEEHEHDGQLPQSVAALAPADGRLGQQVAAQDDGAEDDRLARHRHRGIRTAVGRVVPPDHEHVDVLQHRHHGERDRRDDQVERHGASLRRAAGQDRVGPYGGGPAAGRGARRGLLPPDHARTAA